jgi:hypothetical protein
MRRLGPTGIIPRRKVCKEGAAMSSSLIRWSGLTAMLGGVLWALWSAGQLQEFGGGGEPGGASFDPYVFFNRLLPLVILPVLAGFVGLHAAQRRSYRWLGTAGFAIVLVGFVLIVAGSVGEFWFFYDQPYGQPNGRDASYTLFLLGHPVLAVGTLLFGIATVRARVFPRDASMMFASLGTFGALVPVFGAFIFAFPFVWLGYLLWSSKHGGVRQTSRVS